MSLFKNITSHFPKNTEETQNAVYDSYKKDGPCFISLKSDPDNIKSITDSK